MRAAMLGHVLIERKLYAIVNDLVKWDTRGAGVSE